MAFNLYGLNFNQSVLDSQGHVINKWEDILNRANLDRSYGWKKCSYFPLDLAMQEEAFTNCIQLLVGIFFSLQNVV